MVTINTPRLRLRPFEQNDLAELAPILADPQVMAFSSKGPMDRAHSADFIEWCENSYTRNGFGPWAVIANETKSLIGLCGLSLTVVDGIESVQLGYRLARSCWGQGLATEAAGASLEYGFDTLGLDSIHAIVSPRHHASLRVLEKIGFRDYVVTTYQDWSVRVYHRNRL